MQRRIFSSSCSSFPWIELRAWGQATPSPEMLPMVCGVGVNINELRIDAPELNEDLSLSANVLSDFINLTHVHNFTVSAQDIFTFRRLSVFTVSFTRILQVLMQIMKRFPLYYWLVKWFWSRVFNQRSWVRVQVNSYIFFCILPLYLIRFTSLL